MRLVRDNGLTIALLVLFLASIPGQWFAGWRVVNEDAARHDGSLMSLGHTHVALPPFERSTHLAGLLQARLDAQVDDIGACGARQHEMNGVGDILGMEHLVGSDCRALLLRGAFLHVGID